MGQGQSVINVAQISRYSIAVCIDLNPDGKGVAIEIGKENRYATSLVCRDVKFLHY